MKITQLETIRIEEFPNALWLEINTDEGVTGLGESFFLPTTLEACVHEHIAPKVLGKDPVEMERRLAELVPYVGFAGSGAEMRALSAFDIALWDLNARAVNLPLAHMLGGYCRREIRTYNTCAGPTYMRRDKGQTSANYGVGDTVGESLDDLNGFLHRPAELAASLLAEGITAMKIWPFDWAAEKSGGLDICSEDLAKALSIIEAIRKQVGRKMDLMLEFHSMWSLPPALKIAQALGPYDIYWLEDPIRMECFDDLKRYADRAPAPVCASETLGGKGQFRELLQSQAAGYVMLDISWCGGLSAARKVAAMAQAYQLPVTPHDCTGPVVLAASTHLCLHVPNAVLQESVRAYLRTWYPEIVTGLPVVSHGQIRVADGAGHGVSLRKDIDGRFTVRRRATRL